MLSYYDVAPLKATLERLVDFDLINTGIMRFSIGAVNVKTGNFIYFDNSTHEICPEHVMASGSLLPGFPATEIQGEHYWDGGLVSNTPLQWVLLGRPRLDTLAFQIDLWNARGRLPRTLIEAELRQKEIRFSSRTRAATDDFKRSQLLRRAVHHLLQQIPDELRQMPEANLLASEADEKAKTSSISSITRGLTRGPQKTMSFRGGRWKSIGSPATTTRCAPCVTRKSCNGLKMTMVFSPSISRAMAANRAQ